MAAVAIDKRTHHRVPVRIVIEAAQDWKSAADKALNIVVDKILVDLQTPLLNACRGRIARRVTQVPGHCHLHRLQAGLTHTLPHKLCRRISGALQVPDTVHLRQQFR